MRSWQVFGLLIFNGLFDNVLSQLRGLRTAPAVYSPAEPLFHSPIIIRKWLVGGLEHQFYFPIYWECHHPNWLSYFSEGWPNHQPDEGWCRRISEWTAMLKWETFSQSYMISLLCLYLESWNSSWCYIHLNPQYAWMWIPTKFDIC